MDELEMENKFNNIISDIVQKKRSDNNSFLTIIDEYNIHIEQLKHSKFVLKTPGEKKSMKDYRLVRKYDILTINNKERLIKPINDDSAIGTILYYVTTYN
ncbi:unnamed protein product [Macrosiphum euphorbiae]|uniref:Uncharacterized protein n=1 Tax=Macrosiphum euphorbiae TaxID=13131 RepID=A0AAV0VZL4_9HEMI|nr:unnamed protein product [Macrosiphum euphorbiae]